MAAEMVNVPVARRFVRRTLLHLVDAAETHGADEIVTDLELVSSELVTNAIEHGDGHAVDVTVTCDGGRVALHVTSRGNTEQVGPSDRWHVADPDSITGRGLGIVRALADRISVHHRADELCISVERDLPAA
ncbi:MAG: ATP-binding protein [Ilumatobacteraceae bacterium]